jgi:hypothetical protein
MNMRLQLSCIIVLADHLVLYPATQASPKVRLGWKPLADQTPWSALHPLGPAGHLFADFGTVERARGNQVGNDGAVTRQREAAHALASPPTFGRHRAGAALAAVAALLAVCQPGTFTR